MPESRDLFWLDALRVSAALGIVLFHVADPLFHTGSPNPTAGDFALGLLRWPVPMFVMISGALLLDSSRTESTREFLRRRARRLLPPLLFWSMFFIVGRIVLSPSDSESRIDGILWLLATGQPAEHMWFLFMIAGLYCATPFLRTCLRQASDSETRWLLSMLLLFAFAHETWVAYGPVKHALIFFMFVPYVGAYLYGHVLRAAPIEGFSSLALALTACVCLVLMSVGEPLLLAPLGVKASLLSGRFSPITVVMTGAVFLLARKHLGSTDGTPTPARRLVGDMARVSLGIYIIHPVVQRILIDGIMGVDVAAVGFFPWVPLLALLTFAVSYLVSASLARMPYVRVLV